MGDRILDDEDERYLDGLAIPERDPIPDIDSAPDVREDSFMHGENANDKRYFTLEKVPRGKKFGNDDYDPSTPKDVYAMMAVVFIFAIVYHFIRGWRAKMEGKTK